jgi:hypothetical protein
MAVLNTSRRRMVAGTTEEGKDMKLASWIIFALVLWFLSPLIFPVLLFYVIIRLVNVGLIGKGVEEAHHDN